MVPIKIFNAGMERARYGLILYDLIHNTRQRKSRSGWNEKFKKLMNWTQRDNLIRVDGINRNSVLIVKNPSNEIHDHLQGDLTSELLRASLISATSAMDRYFHDIVTSSCWAILGRKEDEIPASWKKFEIPVTEVRKALDKRRTNQLARPGVDIKKIIQNKLHRMTFQSIDDIGKAVGWAGMENREFWNRVAGEMRSNEKDIKIMLTKIYKRRNQIAHEADIVVLAKSGKTKTNEISRTDCDSYVQFISSFVDSVERIRTS